MHLMKNKDDNEEEQLRPTNVMARPNCRKLGPALEQLM